MKNFLILILVLISTVSFAIAQTINDYIQSVDLIDMGDYEIPFYSDFCYFDGAIYYVTFDEEDEIKQRYTLVKKTPTSTETTEFYLNFHLIVNRGFKSISVDSNYVILEDQFITYYFLRTPEGLKNIFFTSHQEGAESIKIYGNKIFRSHCNIQGSALWKKNQTNVEVYDLQKKSYDVFDFPNPLGIEYMYFQPRKLIDFTSQNVFVMDVLDYKIKIYNYDGKLVDSIYKPFKDNKIIPTPLTDNSTVEIHKFDLLTKRIQSNREVFLKNLNNAKVMSSINLLSDTTMMICYNIPIEGSDGYTYEFDIWKFDYKKKRWLVSKEGLKMEPYKYEDREGNFDIKKLLLMNNFSAYFNNILITQNKFNYDILKLKTYKTWKEFHGLNEDYLKKSEIPNTIFIYRLQF